MKTSRPLTIVSSRAGIDERGGELFAKGERDALESDVAFQHLLQVAGAFAGQQGGGVHDGYAGLRFKCGGERFAGFDAVGNVIELAAEMGALLDFGEHLQRAEDGQAGADKRKKLLVEDEERLELDLAARDAAEAGARTARRRRDSRRGRSAHAALRRWRRSGPAPSRDRVHRLT